MDIEEMKKAVEASIKPIADRLPLVEESDRENVFTGLYAEIWDCLNAQSRLLLALADRAV